ncbi:MAG: ABC transporter permease subunit [Notoacmeibacter sp.]
MENMNYLAQQFANAVPLAALYAALAAAYALPFGITKRADFSFGAVHAFAGQMLVLFAAYGYTALWLTLPATLAFAGAISLAYAALAASIIGKYLVQRLADQTPNTMLAASLGIMIILMELARIGSNTHSNWLPPFLNSQVHFGGGVTLTQIQIINTGLLVGMAGFAHWLTARTRFGRNWNAVRDDAFAARLIGVNSGKVLRQAYFIGAGIAALAALLNTAYLGTMDFNSSLIYGLKIVFIAAIGGTLSPGAAALGGAALAFAETIWSAFAPLIWRDLFVFVLLVFVLVFKAKPAEN